MFIFDLKNLSQIIAVSKPSTFLRLFLVGISGCPTVDRNWERKGSLPASRNFWTFPFYWTSPSPKNWIPCPSPDHRLHIGKKVSLIDFRQILPNILPAECIFIYSIMTYSKKLNKTKWLNTKQCLAESSSRIIPHASPFLPTRLPPFMLLCCSHQV